MAHKKRSRVKNVLLSSRQGAYFFVIDAFFAAAILILTLILVFHFFIGSAPKGQTFTYAHDFLTFLTQTEVRDFHDSVVHDMIIAGYIHNSRQTIAQEVILDYFLNTPEALANASLLLNRSATSLPQTLQINVTIFDPATGTLQTLYSQNPLFKEKRLHLVARSIEYTLDGLDEIVGPYVLKVEVWS